MPATVTHSLLPLDKHHHKKKELKKLHGANQTVGQQAPTCSLRGQNLTQKPALVETSSGRRATDELEFQLQSVSAW